MKANKKVVIALVACSIALLWGITYTITTYKLDNEIKQELPRDFVAELEGISVQNVKIHTEDGDIGLQDILDTDYKSGDIVDITVEYDNDAQSNKQAYISLTNDEDEVLVKYKDGDYGQILLPMKDVTTPKEFEKMLTDDKEKSKEEKKK